MPRILQGSAASRLEVQMNVEQLSRTSVSTLEVDAEDRRVPTQREVLEELFELLEEYAPTWYTEEHHNRAMAALFARER
jgi:hypothetical protein